MQQRISIITLAVDDLAASRDFYAKVFGWQPIKSSEEEEDILFYQMNGFQLALYPRSNLSGEGAQIPEATGGFTLAYNLSSRSEVDQIFQDLKTCGVKVDIRKMPEQVFWGGYSGYIAGPSGEIWEIAHNPFTKIE